MRSRELLAEIDGAPDREALSALALRFVSDIREGVHARRGWPSSMYGMSKLFESRYTQLLAAELQAGGVMVNATCPGVSHAGGRCCDKRRKTRDG